MRYLDLLETRRTREPIRPLIQPQPFCPDVKLVVRFMPAVYRWIDLTLGVGVPAADIGLDEASVTVPEPYNTDGTLTRACRKWIIEVVSDEVERRGLSICIVFGPNDAVYCHPGGILGISERVPEGGLPI